MRSKRIPIVVIISVVLIFAAGCATITTEKVEDLRTAPNGVRVYQPRVYLLVDQAAAQTTLVYAPDFSRAYDVKPMTVFAKQDFKIEIEEGQLKSLTSNQDTTSILNFITSGAQLGAKAAGVGVSSVIMKGTFGLDTGIWVLNDKGSFEKVPITK